MRNRISIGHILLLMVVGFFSCSCAKYKNGTKAALAGNSKPALKIGDKVITGEELARHFDSRIGGFADTTNLDEAKNKLLEDFMEEQLLLIGAEKANITVSEDEIKRAISSLTQDPMSGPMSSKLGPDQDHELRQSISNRLKIEKYLHTHVLTDVTVSKEELIAGQQATETDPRQEELVHVFEILVSSENLAEKILRLIKGARKDNFLELARFYSISSSAIRGGDLGYFKRGELPEEFEKVIFALRPGQVSPVLRTQYGYHIFLLKEKTTRRQRRSLIAKDEMLEKMLADKQRAAITRKLSDLRAAHQVTIYHENLDFNYKPQKS